MPRGWVEEEMTRKSDGVAPIEDVLKQKYKMDPQEAASLAYPMLAGMRR